MKNRNGKTARHGQCPTCEDWFKLRGLASHIKYCSVDDEVLPIVLPHEMD